MRERGRGREGGGGVSAREREFRALFCTHLRHPGSSGMYNVGERDKEKERE